MWSGLLTAIPSGWFLCDGQNGTPDLRDKFVVGAGSTYAKGDSGGATSKTLTANELPSHTHTATSTFSGSALPAHNHSVNDPSHSHPTGSSGAGAPTGAALASAGYGAAGSTGAVTTGISLNAASAGTPAGTVTTTLTNTGSGNAFSILPPYLALAFIMKA
jgi:microcystin-dependent protein